LPDNVLVEHDCAIGKSPITDSKKPGPGCGKLARGLPKLPKFDEASNGIVLEIAFVSTSRRSSWPAEVLMKYG
jgi:hypothetical protein